MKNYLKKLALVWLINSAEKSAFMNSKVRPILNTKTKVVIRADSKLRKQDYKDGTCLFVITDKQLESHIFGMDRPGDHHPRWFKNTETFLHAIIGESIEREASNWYYYSAKEYLKTPIWMVLKNFEEKEAGDKYFLYNLNDSVKQSLQRQKELAKPAFNRLEQFLSQRNTRIIGNFVLPKEVTNSQLS